MKRQGILSLTGVALLGLIVLMTLHEWDYSSATNTAQREDLPTLVIEQMSAIRHNPDGTPQYRIKAQGLTWFEVTDRSELENPDVEMFGNKARWLVTAEKGEMRQTEKQIDLRGSVRAKRTGDDPLSIVTEHLVYHTSEQRLVIPTSVKIEHIGGRTKAGKLDADLKQGIIKIRGGVETRYAPTAG
ncbi:MAG: LPS export ABC transporter periplasmic protein LptC [Alcanivoracaceae bacterium]|nr:LPS export ABC transporter periplasmic protein LptC [Alcanivoracaceae bacterium]